MLNIKQAAARRLNKQATCFCKGWICSSFLTFPASQRRLVLRPPYQSRLGARPCPISGSLPKTLSVHHHTEQQLYINSYLLVPEVHKFIKTKCGMGESQGGEEQMNPNGAGQTFCFFFFQYQRKKRQSKRSFADESSSILHLDVCAQTLTRTHTRTHADAITCTFNSDKRKEHDRDFSTTASLRMSFICLSRWRTPHKRIFLKELK